MNYLFDFGHAHRRPPMELKSLLGGKGANLAEMTSVLALPVPPGFTIATTACRDYMTHGWPDTLDNELTRARQRLERAMGKIIGDPKDPLLVSVRSGAKFSMPGMMDTVLNLGLNDRSVVGLARQTNDERFACDSYRRFIAMYGRIVLDVPGELFDQRFEAVKRASGATSDALVPVASLKGLIKDYKVIVKEHTGRAFPQAPHVQLRGAIQAVFDSWQGARAVTYRNREKISHELGTAVNVQAMVFGNRDDNSGTGVAFTRNPATGKKEPYGDFLVNAQGEDVVAGIRNTESLEVLGQKFPEVYRELLTTFRRLEHHYRDMCDTEFTIEQGKLWILQTRVGKRTGRAAVVMAVEMTRERAIKLSRTEAIERITEDHLSQILHPQFEHTHHSALAQGLGVSPGAAVGRAYFRADDAVAAVERGEQVILVRTETSPDDVHGMLAAEGILTARGGLVSHAAVVARGWGKPAVVGAETLRIAEHEFVVGATTIREGEWLSIDGTTGIIVAGQVELVSGEAPEEFAILLRWADRIRQGHMGVRANADNGVDAAIARTMGAEGIGLCRTEHMFLAEDRLDTVRKMILTTDPIDEAAALEELRVAQQQDFYDILVAMDGLPVTVRLLDPPLHEFLPSTHDLAIKQATTGLDEGEELLLSAARSWEEVNPMLGTRGVRLGVVKPGLYTMQVRALLEAAQRRIKEGGRPILEIMIPLTISRAEMALARGWVEDAVTAANSLVGTKRGPRVALEVAIGTMIETPRAALLADQIGEVADFFSFGTNDLTQMTFGFSRDDVERRIMKPYLELGLLKENPFEIVDVEGVGLLVRMGVAKGRASNPQLKTGVCGEHGGDPTSIRTFYEAGIDYVSCSPFRVPVARLAAAQAVLAAGVKQRPPSRNARKGGATRVATKKSPTRR